MAPPPPTWWVSWHHHDGRALGLYRHTAPQFTDRAAFAAPWLSLVQNGLGMGRIQPLGGGGRLGFALMHGTAGTERGHLPDSDATAGIALAIDYQPTARAPSLHAGFVAEPDGFLGAHPRGPFGAATANTAYIGINYRRPLGHSLGSHWHALASAYYGHTRPDTAGHGILRAVSPLDSSAFSLGLERRLAARRGDWLGVRLTSGLRVESGHARVRYATGRTRYGEVLYEEQTVALAPDHRALEAEVAWRGAVGAGELYLSLGVGEAAERDAAPEWFGAMQFAVTF